MKTRLWKISFTILVAFSFCAQAVTFTSDANIQAGDNWPSVSIYDTPPNHTTITMTGGTVSDSMSLYNASTLNMSAGNVGGLGAMYQSTVNISGGSVGIFALSNNATATLSQNATISSAAIYDSGIFNMNGGTIAHLGVNAGIVNLRGGAITDSLGAYSSTTVNIFGYDLSKTSSGGTLGYGQVSGFWQNGTSFTIDFGGSETYSAINLIPEPATLLLFSIGTFLLRKSHK